MARIARSLLIFTLVLSFSVSTFAQQQPEEEQSRTKSGPRKQLATIIFCGLGGAVLGLSTLSFYGRPQDRLANIAIGFAVGVIGGTVYVTYGAATKPKSFYGETDVFSDDLYKSTSSQGMLESRFATQNTPVLGYTYNF